jgi:adenine-specific DNA-methyltransferase
MEQPSGILTAVEGVLGDPAIALQGASVYCGDCLDLMRKLPDGVVSLTVTSPPYNIGKEYEQPLPLPDYVDWCAAWMAEVYRITSPTGAFWLNLGFLEVPGKARALPIPYLLWERIPFHLLQEVVWNYGAGVASKKMFSPRNEKFLWCVKDPSRYTFNLDKVRDPNVKYPNQKKNGKLRCNPLGKNPGDVWPIPKVTSGANRASPERTSHPAQFPIAVIDRIVKACSHEGELVLDPFLGSGTTLESCLRNRRIGLGIEIRPDYLQVCRDRLARFLIRRASADSQLQIAFGE